MTTERRVAIAARLDVERQTLLADIASAAVRAEKAEPGDRVDIVRYETLTSQLEAWAYEQARAGAAVIVDLPSGTPAVDESIVGPGDLPQWLPPSGQERCAPIFEAGGVLITLALPLEAGATTRPTGHKPPPPVNETFDSDGLYGRKAVVARFKDQLEKALAAGDSPRPFCPEGIQNVALTDTLREFANRPGNERRVNVPVEYKDGSRASHPFPLRALKLHPSRIGDHDLSLRFALLSIRHTELDAVVDGAWLRNLQISQVRVRAQTDDLVYDISRRQLAALTHGGRRVEIEMYQTGLEMAVVGFYRALVDHLIEQPASVSVYPMYYQKPRDPRPPKNPHGKGKGNKNGANRQDAQRPSVETDSAPYRPGKVWAMKPKGSR